MTSGDLATLATGPFLAGCALLGAAGFAKVRHAEPTRAAARAARLPHSRRAVQMLGAVEITVALGGALIGGWAAAAAAAMFGLLAVVASFLSLRAPSTPCGCLGAPDTPAGIPHVVLDVCCAMFALVVTFGARPMTVISEQPLGGVPFLGLALCAAWLAKLAVTAWPALRNATREGNS